MGENGVLNNGALEGDKKLGIFRKRNSENEAYDRARTEQESKICERRPLHDPVRQNMSRFCT